MCEPDSREHGYAMTTGRVARNASCGRGGVTRQAQRPLRLPTPNPCPLGRGSAFGAMEGDTNAKART